MKPVTASTAYLLISHGSRDPRPQAAMHRLAILVRERLELLQQRESGSINKSFAKKSGTQSAEIQSADESIDSRCIVQSNKLNRRRIGQQTSLLTKPLGQGDQRALSVAQGSGMIVETACLELGVLPLREQIYQTGCRLVSVGVEELRLLPMFLMAGVHVVEDIPLEIDAARELLGESIRLTVCPHLGSHPSIAVVLAKRLESVPAEGSLLVAHGSRRPMGNRKIQSLAKCLGTAVAYWSVPPDIEAQSIDLMQQGCQRLAILPYFLFAGGITDAIAHRTEELAERFPKVKFRLLPTLGATAEVADLVVDLAGDA